MSLRSGVLSRRLSCGQSRRIERRLLVSWQSRGGTSPPHGPVLAEDPTLAFVALYDAMRKAISAHMRARDSAP